MADKYAQCTLKKNNRIQTAWIPVGFAKIGLSLRIKEKEPGSVSLTEDGWIVQHVGSTKVYEDLPVHREGRAQLRSLDVPRKRCK